MKPLRTVLLATATLGATALAAQAEVKVIASIKPVHSLVAAVMQGAGEPGLIVEGAGSPHSYSLKPSQAAALQDADVIFWIGEELEAFLEKPIETIGRSGKAVELIEAHGVQRLELREGGAFETHGREDGSDHETAADDMHGHDQEHGDTDEHDHGGIDMHIWLDPVNAKAMAHEIAETLSDADPGNAALYQANATELSGRLDSLTQELTGKLEPVHDIGYIVFHDAYHYFEQRFGLTPAGSITVSPDVMPGAERLREIRSKIGELDAACVFAEPQFEAKLVRVAIEGSEARSALLDPLGAAIDAGPELYFELMRGMATAFETCLSGAS